jgi:hypothetical protein
MNNDLSCPPPTTAAADPRASSDGHHAHPQLGHGFRGGMRGGRQRGGGGVGVFGVGGRGGGWAWGADGGRAAGLVPRARSAAGWGFGSGGTYKPPPLADRDRDRDRGALGAGGGPAIGGRGAGDRRCGGRLAPGHPPARFGGAGCGRDGDADQNSSGEGSERSAATMARGASSLRPPPLRPQGQRFGPLARHPGA